MRSFSTERFGQRSHDKFICSTTSFERFDLDFRNIIEKCTKWHHNEDLKAWIPGIGSKFRSESDGHSPGPQNLNFGVGKIKVGGRVPMQKLRLSF